MSNDIEQAIKAAGADVAPRITPADIKANIVSEHYFTAGDGGDSDESDNTYHHPPGQDEFNHDPLALITFCVLVLKNGFTVTGESACASPENFDVAVGRTVARAAAVNKIWPLMGYELKSELATRATLQRQVAEDFVKPVTPGLALDSGEFIPAASINTPNAETVEAMLEAREIAAAHILPPTHDPI